MPEVIIKYKKPETLKILKGLAKYFDFTIAKTENKSRKVNGVTILPADKTIVPSDLANLFSNKNLDAEKLRKEAWQRK